MKRLILVIAALVMSCAVMPAWAQTSPQERMRSCAQEWDKMRAAKQTAGRNYREFQRECLARGEAPPATVGASPPPQAQPARPETRTPRAAPQGGAASRAQAQSQCPGDEVVWVNTRSKVYHSSGDRFYGATKEGSYMCRTESERAGFRPAKTQARKSQ